MCGEGCREGLGTRTQEVPIAHWSLASTSSARGGYGIELWSPVWETQPGFLAPALAAVGIHSGWIQGGSCLS